MPLCYRWNPDNKELVGSEEMFKDPLESIKQKRDIWALPADCTLIEPQAEKEGFKIKWDGSAWVYEEEKKEEPEQYQPTEDDLKNSKRWERDSVLEKTMGRVQRYQTQKEAGLATTDDEDTYTALLLYAQYLRDFPQAEGEWWNADILDFDAWCAAQ